ncbi:hypothetical protein [Nocardia gipuzkoensis]|uniref:hypothetical protein n=1 Tax=Nocardia gipuzkoensis TaxID=2749991 RepID=UPI0024569E17|nr:hypothetical protein [Nocardia gipuzkoensis]
MSIRAKLFAAAATSLVAAVGMTGCSREDTQPAASSVVDTTAAPSAARWQLYRGVYVPYTAAGPADVSGAAPARYRQIPQGAVAAAMQGQARLSLAPDGIWPAVTKAVALAGPGRARYATERVMASITQEADPAHTAQFAGFRLEGWTPEAVTVWLATRMPSGTLFAQPTRMVWHDADWKIELPLPSAPGSDDRVPTDPTELPNLHGYTEFHH